MDCHPVIGLRESRSEPLSRSSNRKGTCDTESSDGSHNYKRVRRDCPQGMVSCQCAQSKCELGVPVCNEILEYPLSKGEQVKKLGNVVQMRLRSRQKFDAEGYVGGCGGCSIFVALYYLDRLDRQPVHWDVWPRVKAWNKEELRKGSRDDRVSFGGDFGKLKSVAASYGQKHPLESGDKCAPEDDKRET